MTKKTPQRNGCPDLNQQAVNRNEEAKLRLDLEMGKLAKDMIPLIKRMVKDWDKLKENTKLALFNKITGYNRDFMKDHEASILAGATKSNDEEEEDYSISIDLSSEETASKSLN